MSNYITLEGIDALTENQLDAVCECLQYVLEMDFCQKPINRALTGKQNNHAQQAYGKLERALRWHRELYGKKKPKAKQAEVDILATTCFHCGEPALPKTYGEAPRCERHRDV